MSDHICFKKKKYSSHKPHSSRKAWREKFPLPLSYQPRTLWLDCLCCVVDREAEAWTLSCCKGQVSSPWLKWWQRGFSFVARCLRWDTRAVMPKWLPPLKCPSLSHRRHRYWRSGLGPTRSANTLSIGCDYFRYIICLICHDLHQLIMDILFIVAIVWFVCARACCACYLRG